MIEYYPVTLKRLDRDMWDNLVEQGGTVFHLSAWLSLWEKSFPFQASVYLATEGEEILGGIPFCHRDKFNFREAYSMPRGCYGGAVIKSGVDPEIRLQLESEFTYWCMRENFTRINLVEFAPTVNTNLESYSVQPLMTHLLNLKYSSEEQLEKLAQSHQRNLAKSPEAQFLSGEVGSTDDVADYFSLVKETAERQGRTPFYRSEFYSALLEIFANSPKLYWPRLTLNGRMVASAIIFIHRDMAIYWDGVSSEEALDTGANFQLFWNLIQRLKKDDIEILNFGASPRNKPGLKRFKLGWGSEKHSYFEYDYQKPLSRLVGRAKRFL